MNAPLRPQQAWLLIVRFGQLTLARVSVPAPRLAIGRRPYNDLVLQDLSVSGEHAQIALEADTLFLHDLKSRNGTRVNGRAIRHCGLCAGDVIQIGLYELVLEKSLLAEHERAVERLFRGDARRKKGEHIRADRMRAEGMRAEAIRAEPIRAKRIESESATPQTVEPEFLYGGRNRRVSAGLRVPALAGHGLLGSEAGRGRYPSTALDSDEDPHEVPNEDLQEHLQEHLHATPKEANACGVTPIEVLLPDASPNPAGAVRAAVVDVLTGVTAGERIVADRPMTTLGLPGAQVAELVRAAQGYELRHLRGPAFPLINGLSIGDAPQALVHDDLIELGPLMLRFRTSG
jgi:pSer/pThr/pTyr-binding forkhead associated (FHA) protein